MRRIKEQFQYDKRFHPSVIGTILLVFSLSVAYFISYMEGYNYFNALYACFITYSTIGFGDIDIFVSSVYIKYVLVSFSRHCLILVSVFREFLTGQVGWICWFTEILYIFWVTWFYLHGLHHYLKKLELENFKNKV